MRLSDEMILDAEHALAGFDVFDRNPDSLLSRNYYELDPSSRSDIHGFLRKHAALAFQSIHAEDLKRVRKHVLRQYGAFLRILQDKEFPYEAALESLEVEWPSPSPRFFFEEGYRHFYWDMRQHEAWLKVSLVPPDQLGVPRWED